MNMPSLRGAAKWIVLAASVAGCSGADVSSDPESQPPPERLQVAADALTGNDVAVLPRAKVRCGGPTDAGCPINQACVYEAGGCEPGPGSSCTGVCVAQPPGAQCGGLAALPCPGGQICALDAEDDCDPTSGADCPGVCVSSSF